MRSDSFDALTLILDSAIPRASQRPAEWAAEHVYFSDAKDSIKGRIDFSLSPFLVDPINAWELEKGQGLKEITVVAPEQTGKTLSWLCGEMWALDCSPGLSLIYYTSGEKAERINEEKFEPLLSNIPFFRTLLSLPLAKTADCYRLGENLVYFGGVGSRISSSTARRTVADELDDWQDKKGVNSLHDLRKRSRSFSEALCCKVCTPSGTDKQSRIWREFKASSQGYWYLRCQKCGELTMRSCDVHNLQFEVDEAREVVPDSMRLVCPKCGAEHVEDQKRAMNISGGYLHKRPELIKSLPGFQWGALASQMVALSWREVASAQLHAGKSSAIDRQIYFDNSIRGLPFKARQLDSSAALALKRHGAPLPPPGEIKYRFFSADTQDLGFYWVIRGIDVHANSYLLASGKADTLDALGKVWDGVYHGGRVVCGIIDEGGHRAGEVRDFARERPGIFTYKGNSRIGKHWKESEEIKRLILGNAEHYRVSLLYLLYAAQNAGSCYWFVPEDLSDDYREQMAAWKPNLRVRDGDSFENYVSDGGDHFFDAEKMLLLLLDYFAEKILPMLAAVKKRKF